MKAPAVSLAAVLVLTALAATACFDGSSTPPPHLTADDADALLVRAGLTNGQRQVAYKPTGKHPRPISVLLYKHCLLSETGLGVVSDPGTHHPGFLSIRIDVCDTPANAEALVALLPGSDQSTSTSKTYTKDNLVVDVSGRTPAITRKALRRLHAPA